jgi:TetR/AcrR family transcriptional regulator, lmrAB and yxaGH operons repressor
MPPSSSDTRARLLDNSAQLFGRYGYTGTGLKAILAASDAPFGSLYHFFPGGKEELGAEAVRESGRNYLGLVEAFYPVGGDVVAGTQQFFEVAAQVMELTEYVDACQIATVALEVANTSEPMREACAEAFDSWLSLLQTRFIEAGIEDKRASELAVELFCAVEGAFLLSRTIRSPKPLHVTGLASTKVVRDALPKKSSRKRRPKSASN